MALQVVIDELRRGLRILPAVMQLLFNHNRRQGVFERFEVSIGGVCQVKDTGPYLQRGHLLELDPGYLMEG